MPHKASNNRVKEQVVNDSLSSNSDASGNGQNAAGSPAAQIAPFIDTAAVWNNNGNINKQRWLLGTGVGVITNLVETVQARLDVGIPLIKIDESGDRDQAAFIYFSIDYRCVQFLR